MKVALKDEIRQALMCSDKPLSTQAIRWKVEEDRRERELIAMSEGFNKFKQSDFPPLQSLATFKRVISTIPDVEVIVINKTHFRKLKSEGVLHKAMITRVYSCLQNHIMKKNQIMKSYQNLLDRIELLKLPKMWRSLLVKLDGLVRYPEA